MKVACYCRVSSDEQKDKQSILTQVDFATRYTQLHDDLEIVEIYKDDGVSGGIPCKERPEGARLLADAKAHKFDMLLIYRVDRLSRSLLDLLRTSEALEEWGITLRSMTEPFDTSTALGKFVLQLLGMLAELEKANIRDRSVTGSMRCAREGKWLGGMAPLGYNVKDGKLVVERSEAAIVDRIFTLCGEDKMSLGEIADLLNAENVPVRNESRGKGRAIKSGKGWQRGTLSKILHNTTYLGQSAYGKRKTIRKGGQVVGHDLTDASEQIIREAPPIISPEAFAKAGASLRTTTDSPANAKRQYLLRGLVKCGICGSNYCGVWPSDRNVFYYKCNTYMEGPKGNRCQSATMRGDKLEADVWEDIQEFARNPGKVMEKLHAQVQAQNNELAPLHVEQAMIARDIQSKQEERQRIIGLVRRALISDAEAEVELTTLQRDMDALEKRTAALSKRASHAEELNARLSDADNVLHNLAQVVEGATEQTKRQVIELFVRGIKIDTMIEDGKKVAKPSVIYAFDSVTARAEERVREVIHGLE